MRADRAPGVEQPLDRVGDLQLVPPARPDRGDRVVDRRTEQVDAREREVAARTGRLLLQADDPSRRVELGHAELPRVGHPGQQDHRVRVARVVGPLELLDERVDAADEDVVAEVHDERLVTEEVARDEHRVGQAERCLLAQVGDLQPERRPVADRRPDLGLGVADDDADLGDPGRGHRVERVEEHRAVGHRDELLGRGVRERAQPRAGTAAEHERLHDADRVRPGCLLQQAGQPAVGERLAAGLAGRAVLQRRVGERHLARRCRRTPGRAARCGRAPAARPSSRPSGRRPPARASARPRRSSSDRIASYSAATSASSSDVAGLNGDIRAACRISSEYALPMPAITDWSRSTPLSCARPCCGQDRGEHLRR